jgi:hypothetical protein
VTRQDREVVAGVCAGAGLAWAVVLPCIGAPWAVVAGLSVLALAACLALNYL